MDRTRSSRSSN